MSGAGARRAAAALALAAAFAVRAQSPAPLTGDCHLDCGQVLKACLEASNDRYTCIDVTDLCMQRCKAGEPLPAPDGKRPSSSGSGAAPPAPKT